MKYMNFLLISSLFFVGSLFGMDRNNQSLSERIGAINYHRMVIRSQEHENIMDKEIEDSLARRYPDMHEEFRSRKISPSLVRLGLEVALELIVFLKKLVDLHDKEDAKNSDKKQKESSLVDVQQQQVMTVSSKDKEVK